MSAVQALAHLGSSEETHEILLQLVQDDDDDVRDAAATVAMARLELQSPLAESALVKILVTRLPPVQLCSHIDRFGACASPPARAPVLTLLQSKTCRR